MRIRLVLGVCLAVLAIGGLAAACGDSNDDDDGDSAPEATEPVDGRQPTEPAGDGNGDGDGDAPSGLGSATLTIGDETWMFDDYFCAFGSEETQNARVSFSSGSFGESSTGARTQLDASIQDTDEQDRLEGDGTIHSVTLNDVDDFENPSVAWEAVTGIVGAPAFTVQVDGKTIRAEATFDDGRTDEIEAVPGTFEGNCP